MVGCLLICLLQLLKQCSRTDLDSSAILELPTFFNASRYEKTTSTGCKNENYLMFY